MVELRAGGGAARQAARVKPAEHERDNLGWELKQSQRRRVRRDSLTSARRRRVRRAPATRECQLGGCEQTDRRLVWAKPDGLSGAVGGGLRQGERGRGYEGRAEAAF